MVHVAWYMSHGTRRMVHVAWYMSHGTCRMVHAAAAFKSLHLLPIRPQSAVASHSQCTHLSTLFRQQQTERMSRRCSLSCSHGHSLWCIPAGDERTSVHVVRGSCMSAAQVAALWMAALCVVPVCLAVTTLLLHSACGRLLTVVAREVVPASLTLSDILSAGTGHRRWAQTCRHTLLCANPSQAQRGVPPCFQAYLHPKAQCH